jgi:hypothetical protein
MPHVECDIDVRENGPDCLCNVTTIVDHSLIWVWKLKYVTTLLVAFQ